MSKNNRIKVFLLLGVMLVSIIISGCTPEQPTEPSKTEPGLTTVVFHELVNTESIESIRIAAPIWSYSIEINEEDKVDSFIRLHLENMPFTDNVAEVDFVSRQVAAGIATQMSMSLTLKDGSHISINISQDGYAMLTKGEDILVLPRSEKLDYAAIRKYC